LALSNVATQRRTAGRRRRERPHRLRRARSPRRLLRDGARRRGAEQSFTRGANVNVTVRDPLAAHRALLDRYTDANMHDLTTYLWTLK